MTLAQIASQICSALDRQTDYILEERVKDLVINERNMLVHREIDKYGVNEAYIQPYNATLITVNASNDPLVPSSYTLLRTTNKIPLPIRYQSDVPFVFVGSLDRRLAFSYMRPYLMDSMRTLRLIGNATKYFYTNEYIYIFNNSKLSEILIEAVFTKLDVTQATDDPTGFLYQDDMEFPLAGDMLNTVIQDIITLLRSGNDLKQDAPVTERDLN
jgi:hypothetical protein